MFVKVLCSFGVQSEFVDLDQGINSTWKSSERMCLQDYFQCLSVLGTGKILPILFDTLNISSTNVGCKSKCGEKVELLNQSLCGSLTCQER